MTDGQQGPLPRHYQVIMQRYDASLSLSQNDFFAYMLVAGMLNRSLQADEQGKQIAAAFIFKLVHDTAFNKQLNATLNTILSQSKSPEDPAYLAAMEMLELIFHTRWLQDILKILNKMNHCHDTVVKGGKLSETKKLTLREYALVRDLNQLKPVIDKLEQIQTLQNITELQQAIVSCNRTIRDIDLKIKIDSAKQAFFPIQKRHPYSQKLLNYFAHLTEIFCAKQAAFGW